ncbi:hypothetical protein GCM10027051_26340 [Niabella terrae]
MNEQHSNITLLEAVERYIMGEMNPDERLHFENLRRSDSDVDQLVVEHTLFLQKLNRFNQWEKFQRSLNEIHKELSAQGKIDAEKTRGGKLRHLYHRYRKTAIIAASIAGITTLILTGMVRSLSNKSTNHTQFEILKNDINNLALKSKMQDQEIHKLKQSSTAKNIPEIPYTNSGTGFLIDGKGYLVTNSHVIENAQNVAVQNVAGKEFLAKVVYSNPLTDIAIVKITDKDFKSLPSLPYSFTKKNPELAEQLFTLGYPREDIVYNEGYLSSKTGYRGDTMSFQIDMTANRGNSGSPIMNHNGEVLGILNGRQKDVEGFAFAIQSRNIFKALDELKDRDNTDSTLKTIKLNTKSSLYGMKRSQQTNKIEDYIYMVKVN